MALRYEWAWRIQSIGTVAIKVTDDGGTSTVSLTSGTYAHTSISSVVPGYTAFSAALKAALDADSTLSGTYTVTWNGTTGYTISVTGSSSLTLSFATTTAAHGTRMQRILGFSADQSGATSYSSDVRPYFMIIPAIQGRSELSDEYEPPDIAMEDVADDGTAELTSRYEGDDESDDDGEVWLDWTQNAETETGPSVFSGEGTFVFKRQATSAVPWTYQHAFKHMRRGHHPFLVLDGSEKAVCQIRADGASFTPRRFAGTDQPFWTIPFRTRLLGRIS